jgi:hypothetical protein
MGLGGRWTLTVWSLLQLMGQVSFADSDSVNMLLPIVKFSTKGAC